MLTLIWRHCVLFSVQVIIISANAILASTFFKVCIYPTKVEDSERTKDFTAQRFSLISHWCVLHPYFRSYVNHKTMHTKINSVCTCIDIMLREIDRFSTHHSDKIIATSRPLSVYSLVGNFSFDDISAQMNHIFCSITFLYIFSFFSLFIYCHILAYLWCNWYLIFSNVKNSPPDFNDASYNQNV